MIGRPRMNSKRSLILDAKINPKKTTAELLKDWKSSLPTSISTVKRFLQKYNLFAAKNYCKVFEMLVIGFSGANAMPKWVLFSVTKAD